MSVLYEWTVETLDIYPGCGDDPDIIDTSAFESLEDAIKFKAYCEEPSRLVLVRQQGNDIEGLTDRSWAYIKKMSLPEYFCYGADEQSEHVVPKKYKQQWDRYLTSYVR